MWNLRLFVRLLAFLYQSKTPSLGDFSCERTPVVWCMRLGRSTGLFAATVYTQYIRVITDEQPDIPSIHEWRVKTDEPFGLEDFLSVDQMTCNHLRS